MCNYISFENIVQYGVSLQYLKKVTCNYRKGLSKSWANIKAKDDARKVLIDLDTIPETTRKKYNVPTGAEYTKMRNEEASILEQQRINEGRQTTLWEEETRYKENVNFLREAYHNEWLQYMPLYRKCYGHNLKTREAKAKRAAKSHAFWLKMVAITGGIQGNIYGMATEAYQYLNDLKREIALASNITSAIYFRRKLKGIRETLEQGGCISVHIVDGAAKPKDNNRKTGDFHLALATSILSHPKAYSYRVVTDLVNHHCELEGLPLISESWVKKKMAEDNKLRAAIEKTRYGQKRFNDFDLPHAVRTVTPYPGTVWMIDGTPVPFFCYNESRTKSVRLNLFAVIDVCSRKIVGFDISYTEDRFNILNALKMAVTLTGHLPSEIVSDNFSAAKTEEIIQLKAYMENMGVNWRHSRVENPQDKTFIERFFGKLQTVEASLYNDYLGEGIRSKRLNGRPDPKYIEAEFKKKGLLSYKQMCDRICTMLGKYNERATGKKLSPNQVYKDMPKPNVVEIDSIRKAFLFWNKTSYTVKRGMVKIKVKGIEHAYEIYDDNIKMAYRNEKVTVRYDENDLDTIMLFDAYEQPICECRKAIQIHIAGADRTEADILKTMKIEAKRKRQIKHTEDYLQDIRDKGLKAVNKKSLDIVHPLSLGKNQVNTQESLDFMALYKRDNSITPDDEDNTVHLPIATIGQTGYSLDARESLLERKGTKKNDNSKPLEIVK